MARYEGRPPALTEEVADRIVQVLSIGCSYRVAADAAGVSESAIMAWKRRGLRYLDRLAGEDDPFQPCPTCGAEPGEHCVTSSGRKASPRHSPRPAPLDLPDDYQRYVDFLERCQRARSQAELQSVAKIRKAADDDWRAAAWFLERSRPEVWGRRTRVEYVGPDGDRLEVDVQDVADQLDRYVEELGEDEDLPRDAHLGELRALPGGQGDQ